eukprot:2168920-Rhodomonas_salina.1
MQPSSGGSTNIATPCPSVRCQACLSRRPHWSSRLSKSLNRHAVSGPLYVNTGTTHVENRFSACVGV